MNGKLFELAVLIGIYPIKSLALFVIDEVAKLAEELNWFQPQNLQKTNLSHILKIHEKRSTRVQYLK